MNILGVDFMSFVSGDFGQTWGDRLLEKTIRKTRRCGNRENPTNIGMINTVVNDRTTLTEREQRYELC